MLNWAAWGISWLGSWGNSWGPLHEVEEEPIIGGGGKPFTGRIPKTRDDREDFEPHSQYPKYHPWIHSPAQKYVESLGQSVAPDIVAAIIESVAKVSDERVVQQVSESDVLAAEREFREFIKNRKMEWTELYSQLIRLEYDRLEQEYNDAQIVLMLFEM